MTTQDPTIMLFDAVKSKIGNTETGGWHTISSRDVELFGKVTHNEQFIHTDQSLALAESPYGALIAHAYLTLALIPFLAPPLTVCPVININYGFNRIRFPEATKIRCKRPRESHSALHQKAQFRSTRYADGYHRTRAHSTSKCGRRVDCVAYIDGRKKQLKDQLWDCETFFVSMRYSK